MQGTEYTYQIGQGHYYGQCLAVGNFREVDESLFFTEINRLLEQHNLTHKKKVANKISNLKKVVTIGNTSFKIERKKK